MRLKMVRADGGLYPFISATTNFLKLLPPSNCSGTPLSVTSSTTAFSKRRRVLFLRNPPIDGCIKHLPPDDDGVDEAVALPALPLLYPLSDPL